HFPSFAAARRFPWRPAGRPAKLCGMTTIPAAAGVRAWTAADRLAERYFDEQARLDPITATFAGLAEHADRLTDLSPAGHGALAELARGTLVELAGVPIEDDVDQVTVAALTERLQQ